MLYAGVPPRLGSTKPCLRTANPPVTSLMLISAFVWILRKSASISGAPSIPMSGLTRSSDQGSLSRPIFFLSMMFLYRKPIRE